MQTCQQDRKLAGYCVGEVISMASRWLASELNLEPSVMSTKPSICGAMCNEQTFCFHLLFPAICGLFVSRMFTGWRLEGSETRTMHFRHRRVAASASGCISKLLHQRRFSSSHPCCQSFSSLTGAQFSDAGASGVNARSQSRLLRLKQSFV